MHPFLASTKVKIFGGVLILLTASVQWAFLMYYGNAPLKDKKSHAMRKMVHQYIIAVIEQYSLQNDKNSCQYAAN